MKAEFKDVPYRRISNRSPKGKLVDCKEGQRLMTLMGKMLAAGKAVDFTQSQPLSKTIGEVYDTISLTITD